MAESPTQKSEWLIVVPDFPGAAAKRPALMGQHLERMKSDPEGFWVFGGATLHESFIPGSKPPQVSGSAMLVFATSHDEILQRLKDDPLTAQAVWDVDNAKITPFFRPKRYAL